MKRPASKSLEPREAAQIGPRQLKEPSSPAYAWQTIAVIQRRWQSKEISLEKWQEVLQEAQENRIWEKVPEGKPYGSLDALLRAEIGRGLEEANRTKAQQLAADPEVKEQPTRSEAMKGNQNAKKEKENSRSDRTTDSPRGETASYLVRRLKRDHPEINDALARGEYKSARAAGIAAGIVKEPTTWEKVLKAVAKLSAAEKRKLARLLAEEG
jgi:hypothetical protein